MTLNAEAATKPNMRCASGRDEGMTVLVTLSKPEMSPVTLQSIYKIGKVSAGFPCDLAEKCWGKR